MAAHPREATLFVQQTEDTFGRFLNEFETLCVVSECDVRVLDPFLLVL